MKTFDEEERKLIESVEKEEWRTIKDSKTVLSKLQGYALEEQRNIFEKIEDATLAVEEINEAAAVAVQNDVKEMVYDLYITLKPGLEFKVEDKNNILTKINQVLSSTEKPESILIVPALPKTRSGKIMRKVLSVISNEGNLDEVTTIPDVNIVGIVKDLERIK